MGKAKDLITRSVDAWNAHDRDAWVGAFTEDVELAAPGMTGSGLETVGQFYGIWQDSFPDCQVEPVAISEDGENGVVEAVFHGTHTGPLNAPSGTIPPTGKKVSVPFVVTGKVAGGKFTRFHLYFDQVELLTQLGLASGS